MTADVWALADRLGPEKVLFVKEPQTGLKAIVVVDNTAAGVAIGGVRMATDVTVDEVFRLARGMTLKNIVAGLPHGGGKAGIIADSKTSLEHKEALIRAFAQSIRNVKDYVPGPDMGTNETSMAWVKDEIGRAIGLPRVLGGIPLDEIGATAYGLAVAAEEAAPTVGIGLEGSRIAIQGFGAVGKYTARFLGEAGAKLVAVSDSQGARYNPRGFDVEALIAHKESDLPVHSFADGIALGADALVAIDCDIWIPAARPDVLTEHNVKDLKAKLVLAGANIPATEAAEAWMYKHHILSIPDFVANAGGVICGAVEYRGGSEQEALATIETTIRNNTIELLERISLDHKAPRAAALDMAYSRLDEAMHYRRSFGNKQPAPYSYEEADFLTM